jgi:hypothetical protein
MIGQIATADSIGEPEVILDATTCSRLTARRLALDHGRT